MDYFDNIDSDIKAYILGTIIFNIKKYDHNEIIVQLNSSQEIPQFLEKEFKLFSENIDKDVFVIKSPEVIQSICNSVDINNIELSSLIQKYPKGYAIEILKAFYEKYGNINNDETPICNITTYSRQYLEAFGNFFGIPYKLSKIFNLEQLTYTNVNVIDLLGILYKNKDIRTKHYDLLNCERPILKYIKTSKDAITPTKANFSDVGYDLSIIGIAKEFNSKTKLYNTGIKLDIPVGYYVEIVPRSSISKSGYILANSVGIIDCSYKGELLVALSKIDEQSQDITFPYRCCQLIMRKQIFPDMIEISELGESARAEGGFGSSG